MQVIAVARPGSTVWRWRIVSYAGDLVEESADSFPTIAVAIAQGARRMASLNRVDDTIARNPSRWVSRARPR
jgi:hypothetical protein